MRELARIQFRGDTKEFVDQWNRLSSIKIEQRVIAIYKDIAEYELMKGLFSRLSQQHNMTWFQIYRTEVSCSQCNRMNYVQARNLVLNPFEEQTDEWEVGLFQHDVCETDFHEVIVSERVIELFRLNNARGIITRPVDFTEQHNFRLQRYYQLQTESTIKLLVPPSRIERLDSCEVCGQYKQVLMMSLPGTKDSEFYFARNSYGGDWIMSTSERFGRTPNFHAQLVISQNFYRLLKTSGITGFWVQPAHLI
jgi:hypothetical protein